MYFERTLKKILQRVSKSFPVLLVTGPRQVGKTTFLRELAGKERQYVSLDNLTVRALAKKDPEMFLQKYKAPLFIDEIQYAPELLSYIKIEVDKKQESGMFWLTGSQKFHLMKGVSESLAGRVGILQMLGFSLREIQKKPETSKPFFPKTEIIEERSKNSKILDLESLYKTIWRGSFPSLYSKKKNEWNIFYDSYVTTYIERDIRDLVQVANEQTFLRFLRTVAARTGQLIQYSDMARDVGISVNTAKNWVSLLETSGIIYILEPYHTNRTTRIVKAPKLYFLDTGLCSFLTRWQTPETLETGAMSGAMFETFVVSEIVKSYWHNGESAPLYFYRDNNKKEVDILIEQNGKLYPVEVKKSAMPNGDDAKNFNVLKNLKVPIGQGAIVCLCKDWLPITKDVNMMNVGMI